MSEYITSWHEKGRAEGREQGLIEGRAEILVEIARRLIDMDLVVEQIEYATELPREIIESLRFESRKG